MTQPVEPAVELTPRQALVARLEELQAAYPDEAPPELADRFARSTNRQDRRLITEFVRAEVRNILAYEFRALNIRTRRRITRSLSLPNLEVEHQPEEDTEETPAPRRSPVWETIAAWKEFSPLRNREMPLFHMNWEDLDSSERDDFAEAGRRTWKGLFKRRLKARLEPGQPSQTVENVWSATEIVRLKLQAEQEVSRGDFRLVITPLPPLSRPS